MNGAELEGKLRTWQLWGRSDRYTYWVYDDEEGRMFNCTLDDTPPTAIAGYGNLQALRDLKGDKTKIKLDR